MTASLYGAARIIALDLDANRLEKAKAFGATDVVNNSDEDWIDQVKAMTDGFGVDVAIEAVGIPETFDACTKIVRPGGSVANVGVHGAPVELALQDLWIMDISITTGLVSTNTTPMLLKLVAQDKLAAAVFRDPSLHVRAGARRLRHLRPRRRDQGTQGRHQAVSPTRPPKAARTVIATRGPAPAPIRDAGRESGNKTSN